MDTRPRVAHDPDVTSVRGDILDAMPLTVQVVRTPDMRKCCRSSAPVVCDAAGLKLVP